MGASRKLQGEIDSLLKKVQEGVDVFNIIWNKVYETENANQKTKFEADLKKEIKKLQRYRDQIKKWQRSTEIKNKKVSASYEQALMDSCNLIANEMTRFKISEKQAETNAFSKEDLEQQPKLDPKEKAKSETREWVNNTMSQLESQIDSFETEMEGLFVKKGKTRPPRLIHLELLINRHKAHIMKLELILRFLDNDELSPEQVNDVKDFLDYYVERNQEDFDEFDDVDMLYSTLPLDKGVGAAGPGPGLSIKPALSASTAHSPMGADNGVTEMMVGLWDHCNSGWHVNSGDGGVKDSLRLHSGGEQEQERGSSSTVDAAASIGVLNEDVIQKIISVLPVVSLFRFQLVCKNWEAKIRTLLTSRTQGVRFLLPVAPPFHSVDVGNNPPPYFMIRHESSIRGYETLIVGPVNDIVFVVCCGFASRFHLYNPTVGADIEIPRHKPILGSSTMQRAGFSFSYGFGFGETKNDLKIVCIQKASQANTRVCNVYSVAQSRWSVIDQSSSVFVKTDVGVFLPGTRSLYWLCIKREHAVDTYFILRLDLVGLDFSEFPIEFGEGIPVNNRLGTFFGTLSMLVQTPDGSHHLKILTQDNQWANGYFRNSLHRRFGDGFFLLCVNDGKLLLLTRNESFPENDYRNSILTIYNILDDSYGEVINLDTVGLLSDNTASPYIQGPTLPSDLRGRLLL